MGIPELNYSIVSRHDESSRLTEKNFMWIPLRCITAFRIPSLCWGTRSELSLLGETPRVLVPEAQTDPCMHPTRSPHVSLTVKPSSPTVVSL